MERFRRVIWVAVLLLYRPVAARSESAQEQQAFERGRLYYSQHKYVETVATLEPLRSGVHVEEVLYILTDSYLHLGDASKCKAVFTELSTDYPDSAWLHELYGMALDNEGSYPRALQEFQAALTINPGMPNASFAIGYIHWKQKRFDEAAMWFKRETQVQPCHAPAHYYIGAIARQDNHVEVALSEYRKATACDAAYGDAYVATGEIFESRNDWKSAAAAFDKAISVEPGNLSAHYRLAAALRKLGRSREADVQLDVVKRIHADRLQKANAALKQGS